jgi:hypothetical protein
MEYVNKIKNRPYSDTHLRLCACLPRVYPNQTLSPANIQPQFVGGEVVLRLSSAA